MHLTSLDDFQPAEIRAVLDRERPPEGRGGGLVVVLDFLPLGPAGLALRAAAARAGVDLVTGAEIFPGFPRGVDLLDAAAAAGAYGDAVVLRHPLRGSARAASLVSPAPVLSAGDGAGEDPLFGLCDLAQLDDRLGGVAERNVALCGDLRRNRRVHSLAGGLLALGARVLLVPAKGAEPADGFLDRMARQYGFQPVRFEAETITSLLSMVDSWLLTPDLDHQLPLFAGLFATSAGEKRQVRHQVREIDAMWMAATRDERGEPTEDDAFGSLTWRGSDGGAFVAPDDPENDREDWSRRAALDVAVLTNVLRRAMVECGPADLPEDAYVATEGMRCTDPGCIACREPVRVPPAFAVTRTDPVLLSCRYCWSRRKAHFVGSRKERRFHPLTSREVRKILRQNTVFFASREEAEEAGFVASKVS